MADSLILDVGSTQPIELLDEGASNFSPSGLLWTARLATTWDLGDPVPDTDTVAGLLLDGELVTGRSSSNRTVTLNVVVDSRNTAGVGNRTALSQALSRLTSIVDQPSWTMQWAPDLGPELLPKSVRDCFQFVGVWLSNHPGNEGGASSLRVPAVPGSTWNTLTATGAAGAFTAQTVGQWPVTAGKFYTASAWFMQVPTGWEQQCQVSLTWFNAAGAQIGTSSGALVAHVPGSPVQATVGATAPTGAVSCSVTVGIVPTSGTIVTGHSFGFGGVSLIQGLVRSLPMLLDCYRGKAQVSWTGRGMQAGTAAVQLTFPAKPFGRSPSPVDAGFGSTPLVSTVYGQLWQLAPGVGDARSPLALDIALTTAPNLQKAIIHQAPPEALPGYCPLFPINTTTGGSSILKPLNGPGGSAPQFQSGTYSVWLHMHAYDSSVTTTHQVTVQVLQITNSTSMGTIGSNIATRQYVATDVSSGGLLYVGEVDLPAANIDPSANTGTTWSVSLNTTPVGGGSAAADTFYALILMDTRGETIVLGQGNYSAQHLIIDPPGPLVSASSVRAGDSRADAVAVGGDLHIPTGPLSFEPAGQRFLVYTPDGAATTTGSYSPLWRAERTQ